jgi:hypothetical protein
LGISLLGKGKYLDEGMLVVFIPYKGNGFIARTAGTDSERQ